MTAPALPGLDWVIVGGESGRKRRAFAPAWAAGIQEQCRAAGVAFFYKQGGGLFPGAEPFLEGRGERCGA